MPPSIKRLFGRRKKKEQEEPIPQRKEVVQVQTKTSRPEVSRETASVHCGEIPKDFLEEPIESIQKEMSAHDLLIGKDEQSAPKQPENVRSSVKAIDIGYENDSPLVRKSYEQIPLLEQTKLPRGGISIETKAVGRVQFGIPPETIKDSMKLGLPVPQVYIVPVERFCREMGPALGVNLAEFEFPAYFNFFVYKKRCVLVVDSDDAEENIRRVFGETLLGPEQFRREQNPITHEEEDFAPDFPEEAKPNFQKESQYFRIMPDGKELVIETLLDFCHFEIKPDGHENLGFPPAFEDHHASATKASLEDEDVECEIPEGDEEAIPQDLSELEKREKRSPWTFAHARFMGDVATVWPFEATPDQIRSRSVPRVEIFKMPGGTEYIVHDINEDNIIIGKARVSGHVKVSELMSVDGFGGHSILDDLAPQSTKSLRKDGQSKLGDDSESSYPFDTLVKLEKSLPLPSFHPPSFGVTVLGNSHGFDSSGSVSGYVLWINGRGVMIDPPPYSSATLEREGIRPRMIVGIILTHCHADHDAGAFQKVLTGSPVVVITTPTIYKSFIRKYAALSALSPALLRHSHRYKPAIIGKPLRFQGATFNFIYTLHTIPCIGFRVEWRGRSMVFTGDHFNSPPDIERLKATGVLTKERADDLSNLPLQECDVILHEAGAPPIHTPLAALLNLPVHVKKRLYVVHTSALPEGCELKVAPTGTAGTIRLDQSSPISVAETSDALALKRAGRDHSSSQTLGDDEFIWHGHNEYETINEDSVNEDNTRVMSSFAHLQLNLSSRKARQNSVFIGQAPSPPLVSLRPASSTDAWFILNLLSAVPFLTSLSYASTMEVLETAKVDAYSINDVVIPASRRSYVLCLIWEGTCSERLMTRSGHECFHTGLSSIDENPTNKPAVWHAGDWTGPVTLQPDRRLSGESDSSKTHDVVAVSSEGVKVITIDFSSLHSILKSGSHLYRKYLDRKVMQERAKMDSSGGEQHSTTTEQLLDEATRNLNVLELLNCNSALRKLSAVQKRHLESLAEGPISYQPGERLWRAGTQVDKAFIVVSGTASFVPKRRNAGSATVSQLKDSEKEKFGDTSLGDSMRVDALKVIKELGSKSNESPGGDESSMSSLEVDDGKIVHQIHFDSFFNRSSANPDMSSLSEGNDYARLSRGLQKRADYIQKEGVGGNASVTSELSGDDSHEDMDSFGMDSESQLDYTFTDEADPGNRSKRNSVIRRRSSRARHANKVLGRLYSRRAFTGGLVFSRGHFLGDVSKMVAGILASDTSSHIDDDFGQSYGFGEKNEGRGTDRLLESLTELIIHEQEGDHHIMHSSTLTAGKDGCVVLVFPKVALIPFLDEYPGLLLSLLGTQVVV